MTQALEARAQLVIKYTDDRVSSVIKGFGNAVGRACLKGLLPQTSVYSGHLDGPKRRRQRDVAAFLGHDDERTTAKAHAHLDAFEKKCKHLY